MKTRIFFLTGILLSIFSGLFASSADSTKATDSTHVLPCQFTLISPIGTNGINAMNTTHYLSVNVIAGYNGGVNGIEFGGFANVLEHDMVGSQFAGFANVVKGNVKGLQAAGFVNYAHQNSEGIMLAGFSNQSMHSAKVMQAAGFSNQVIGSCQGAQFAGFSNFCKDSLTGAQASGFVNFSGGTVTGFQAAGFINITASDLTGMQISGFANVAKNVQGTQISGFINVAKTVKGSQISFINVADSFEQGVPIGFLSFVKKGYHTFSIGGNEMGWAEMQFRTGADKFHNVFAVAINPIPKSSGWAHGYGVGSKLLNTSQSDITLDLMAFQVHENQIFTDAYNALYRLSARYEFHPGGKKFAIWGGPSLNLHQYSTERFDGTEFESNLAPSYTLLQQKGTYIHSNLWFGGQIGISF